MSALIERFLAWIGWRQQPVRPPHGVRINIPRSILQALHRVTTPTAARHEPLAFVRVRFASEDTHEVVVAVGIIPFAEEAYVEGDAGANFETRWVVTIANREVTANTGLLLAHSHGGRERPRFSGVDRETNITVMAPLSIGVPVVPYGALVLSETDAAAVVAQAGRLVDARVVVVPDIPGRMDLSA
jgi:hypothetical protein